MFKKYIEWGLEITSKYVGLRFFIAGGFAGVTDLLLLYTFNTIFGIHYLLSAIFAFGGAFLVSFFLHKFWTFKSHGESVHKQVVLYLCTSLFGLGLNTLLMYIFVDYFFVQVIVSQILVGLIVALFSFSISRKFVFKHTNGS